MKYENTKIYFKNCDYSLHFFNIKTYSFQNTCYKKCPDLTTLNTVSEECECTYYKYYLDLTKTEFKCLNENEQCKDYSQFSIISKKECSSESECINQNYKIFNSFCYDSCPENTEENNNYCGCKFHFYIDGNEYFCFPEEKSCGDTDHPIESNTNRCFLSKENCIVERNKFFNNLCYISSCPANTNDNDGDGVCSCSYFFYKNLSTNLYVCLNQNEECSSKGYNFKIDAINQCFDSLEDCRNKGFKNFNGQCYKECPNNSNDMNNDGICECSNFYFKDKNTNLFNCLGEDETCVLKGYEKKN